MANKAEQLPLELPVETQFHLEDLVITKSNQDAYQLITQWPNWTFPIALLVGPRGSGKSHFASVWKKTARAITVSPQKLDEAIDHIHNHKSVLIENIEPNKFDEVKLFHLINTVKQASSVNHKTTLLLSSYFIPVHWQIKLRDLQSRMQTIPFALLYQPDDFLLKAILTKLFSDRQLQIDDTIIQYIVTHMERSLSAACALVDKADREALIRKTRITKNLIAKLLEDLETHKE